MLAATIMNAPLAATILNAPLAATILNGALATMERNIFLLLVTIIALVSSTYKCWKTRVHLVQILILNTFVH